MMLLSVHPHAKRLMLGGTFALWAVFVPLIALAPWASLLFVFLLSLLLIGAVRILPAEARAFAKEIEAGNPDVDWQRPAAG